MRPIPIPGSGPISRRRSSVSSLRFTFEYAGERIRLVSRQRVDATALPTDELRPTQGETGFWCELRDAKGTTLYRRVQGEHPIRAAVQIRTDDPARPLSQVDVAQPQGTFVLLVPDLPAAATLALVGSPPGARGLAVPAREIARFEVSEGKP